MIGLTEIEVKKNRELYGSNTLEQEKTMGFLRLLLDSLNDPMIRILLIALGIKTVFLISNFDWYETIGVVIAIFIASLISTLSEYGSEQAFKKLQKDALRTKTKVLRNNKIQEVTIDELVVNDLVILEIGDKIPADGYLIDGEINVDESMLTGETKEKEKKINDLLFRGTVVYSKKGIMKITKVGIKTEYGKLASELKIKSPESPLKLRLTKLAKIISSIGYIGALMVFIAYLFSIIVISNHFEINKILITLGNVPFLIKHVLYALTLSVTIIVVSVPEGLPMMITLVLSSNMKRMLKNKVLVRKLVGIETAGSLNILFTDKTGTLTKGKHEVISIMDGNLKSYNRKEELKDSFWILLKESILYNNSSEYVDNGIIGGNSTDKALLNYIGFQKKNYQILNTLPFDSKNKYMLTTIKKDRNIRLIKGAPEKIIKHCTKYYNENGIKKGLYDKDRINNYIENMASKGVRVLALAINDSYSLDDFKELTLVAIIFIKDEIREESKLGIELVKRAGIDTIMITGDNIKTARSIGDEIGMLDNNSLVITSEELENMKDEEIKKVLSNLKIVARALPKDKSRLVRIARELDLVVGMTGDGVNDAPALKQADVGFSMGSGTEVAKEASDIVILDDNFLSISKAILYGRTIFKSIRKFIIFQLTVNLCAISLSIIGPFIGINTPITVIQMLWVNMVMDTLAGLAFSFEPALIEYMNEKPKKKNENIINKYMINEILVTGIYSALLCVLFLKLPFFKELFRKDSVDKYFMTAFFGLFIFIGIFNAFNSRTKRINVFANLFKNKIFLFIILFVILVQIILIYHGGELFRTSGLNIMEFFLIIILSLTVIPFDWLRKYIYNKKNNDTGV